MGFAGVYQEYNPPDWEGPTGFYHQDFRSLPDPDQSKTGDSLYVWAYPSYTEETMFFSLLAQSSLCGAQAYRVALPPSDRRYLLELLEIPDGVVGAPPVGTVWELPLGPLFTLEFPTYRTTDGLEGYRFAFTITRVVTLPGDFDNDGDEDLDDFDQFATCFTGPGGGPVAPGCEPGDFDSDGDIDCEDWNQFVLFWTEAQDPPVFLPCCEPCCGPDSPVSSPPLAEMITDELKNLVVSTKNRFLSFAAGDPGQYQLIRVKFLDLASPYDQFNDNHMWAGEPFQVSESPAHTAPGQPGYTDFWAAKLGCENPIIATDWTTLTGDCHQGVCWHSENAGEACTDDSECVRAIIHVYGDYVVPDSRYEIRVLDSSCPWTLIDDDFLAPPLITDEGPWLATSMWGDTTGAFVNGQWSAADGQVLVPIDVMAVLSKVAVSPIRPAKARVDVVSSNPKVDLSPDRMVDLPYDLTYVLMAATGQGFPYQSPLGPWPCSSPRIGDYSDSGCLPSSGLRSDEYPKCGDDEIELSVEPGMLHVFHRNATYNCCPDDIVVSLSVDGAVLRLTEQEDLTTGGCFCLCCYEVEATVVDLAPGMYTVEFCWDDHETGGEECHMEDIVIP